MIGFSKVPKVATPLFTVVVISSEIEKVKESSAELAKHTRPAFKVSEEVSYVVVLIDTGNDICALAAVLERGT